jgi:spore germination cell wall hydrolase CwlJ-like protein
MMLNVIPQICKSTVGWFGVLCVVLLTSCATTSSSDSTTLSTDSSGIRSIYAEEFDIISVGKRELTKSDHKQLDCLAQNIYYESAQETYEGRIAVAQVTMNRLDTGRWGKDVCTVVHYRSVFKGKTVCQFSWTCMHKGGPGRDKIMWERSKEVAYRVYVDGYRISDLSNALNFHARHVNPRWKLNKIRVIGNHIFYSEK